MSWLTGNTGSYRAFSQRTHTRSLSETRWKPECCCLLEFIGQVSNVLRIPAHLPSKHHETEITCKLHISNPSACWHQHHAMALLENHSSVVHTLTQLLHCLFEAVNEGPHHFLLDQGNSHIYRSRAIYMNRWCDCWFSTTFINTDLFVWKLCTILYYCVIC